MASRRRDIGEQAQADTASECMPCGGRGTLISRLGGQERTVQCPWCEGSGRRRPGVDAQASWLAQRGERADAPGATEANGTGQAGGASAAGEIDADGRPGGR